MSAHARTPPLDLQQHRRRRHRRRRCRKEKRKKLGRVDVDEGFFDQSSRHFRQF